MDTVKTLHNHYGAGKNKSQARRIPGKVDASRKMLVKVVSRANFFRKFKGYCIAEEKLEEAQRAGCILIKIQVRESGEVFFSSLPFFLQHAKSVHCPGYEPQRVLPLKQWRRTPEMPQQEDLFPGGAA